MRDNKRERSQAGRYRNRVIIQSPNTTNVDAGGHVDLKSGDTNWTTYATRWASVIPSSGREFVSGEKVQGDITHVVLCRYDTLTKAVNPTQRVKFGTRKLNIVSAYQRGQLQSEMVMQCREVA